MGKAVLTSRWNTDRYILQYISNQRRNLFMAPVPMFVNTALGNKIEDDMTMFRRRIAYKYVNTK
jgi:hypothetical protein